MKTMNIQMLFKVPGKIILLVMISFCVEQTVLAQNIGINATGATPASSAMLDIASSSSGLLIPRVALTATNSASPVTSPATSLMVYNTATAGTSPNNVVPGFYYWNGSAWVTLGASSGGTGWAATGNAGTTAGTNFIGTTDGVDLVVKTNNTEKARVTSSGNVGIGTSSFNGTYPEKFVVDAGTTSSVNAIVGKGSINNYLQLNIQNQSAGTSASSDVVATADNGSETTNYVDMGINSSTNTSGVMGAANDAYLYNIGQNFLLGTGTAAKSMVFMTGGTSQASNERVRIDGSGNVGVGTNNPSYKFDVNGIIRTGKPSSTNGSLVFSNSSNANTVTFNSGFSSSTYALTLPITQGGANTMLTNNGSGVLSWVTPAAATGAWSYDGNAVAADRNFGTTSNFSLPFITNNAERMRINNLGNVAIGTPTYNATNPEKLVIDAGTTSSVNAIVGKGSINSYLQLNIQNQSAGTSASSDVVATADNGSETTNYVDMGINSSTNTSGIMGVANDAYLYNIGQNFLLGTGTAAKSMVFMTGGTSQPINERMRIDGSGNVGIGYNNPTRKLDVSGAIGTGKASTTNGSLVFSNSSNANTVTLNTGTTSASYALSLPTAQGAASSVLTNNGSGTLTWSSVGSSGAWSTLGNSGTNPSTNFIGTTDNQALVFKVNNASVERFEPNAVAIGLAATTNNSTNAYALGSTATVGFNHPNSYAIGNSAAANSDNSFAIGNSAVVNGNSSLAIGNSAAANSINGVALGVSSVVAYSITDGIAIGTNATANSSNSIAIGGHSTLANKTSTNAAGAIAVGMTATANSANAIAIGSGATAAFSITAPVAIGNAATVNGNNGVAFGNGASIGSVSNATALGSGASVTGSGTNSTAVGYNTAVTQSNALILGDLTNTNLSVGIGSQSFSGTNREKLLVDMGTTSSVNAIVGKGTNPSYLQLNIQNLSNGIGASSDVVATADNGSETNNYVDMGINSSANSSGIMGGANDAYLYNLGQNFLVGTGTAAKSLVFMTGGTSQATNERMRIDGTGKVGIANTSPTEKLDVTGNVRFSGALMPGNSAGTSGYVLTSSGAGVAPTWSNPTSVLNTFSWALDGNSVASARNFGTTSNFSLPFITNNTEKMRLFSGGGLAVGTATQDATNPEKLIVNAGATSSVNAIVGKGSINNYFQLNIQNQSAGSSASSDVVATADNGNETSNYIDMGINGSTNASGIMGAANDGYLYNIGQNLLVGTGTAAKSLIFMTGGTTQSTNERMRINGSGNVGIGNNNPNSTLSVTGSLAMTYRSGSGAYALLATDYVSIHTGGAVTWTLPAANTCSGRIYRLVNQGTGNVTLSQSVTTASGVTTTTLPFGATGNFEIISDGSAWRKIN